MNQKALFQIEKQILENKIKKRQEIITDLEIYNHQYKEDVILIYKHQISIPDLKKEVANKMSIPVESQRMIHKGKQLKDDKHLNDYGNNIYITFY